MSNFSIGSQLPVYLGLNGSGLNDGKIYIGLPNQDPQTFPKTVYWDAAGTDPVDQTNGIATIGGYISRAGNPSTIYADGAYSIRALDRFGSQVFYIPEVVDLSLELAAFVALLASPAGAGEVGKTGGGTVQDFIDYADPILVEADEFVDAYSTSKIYTAGTGGDFSTLVAALDFLQTQPLAQPVTLTLLEKNTPDDDTGSMAIPATGYTFNNVNSKNLTIQGPAFGGGQGVITNAAMTGTIATDLAYCKGRYGASIRINGTNDPAAAPGGGLSFPNGIGSFKRVLFEERGRYSLDFGYNRSHLNAKGPSGATFEDCAFFGSVWGVIGYNAHFSFSGTGNWFGYQVDGGAIALFRSSAEFVAGVANKLQFYQPPVATASGPKYVIYADGAYLALNVDAVASAIAAQGSWLHGLFAINGTAGDLRAASFDGVTQPFSIGDASVNISGFNISNADPANTSLVPGAVQPGVPGNEVGGALISVGSGGNVRENGGTITDCIAARFVFCNGGNIRGYGTIAVTGSKATSSAFSFAASKGNVLSGSIATPQGGSLDQSLCLQNGDVFWFNQSGFTFSPALNTPTNGSGNYN